MGGEVGAKRIGRAPSQVLRGVGLRKLKAVTGPEENHGGKNQCDADHWPELLPPERDLMKRLTSCGFASCVKMPASRKIPTEVARRHSGRMYATNRARSNVSKRSLLQIGIGLNVELKAPGRTRPGPHETSTTMTWNGSPGSGLGPRSGLRVLYRWMPRC